MKAFILAGIFAAAFSAPANATDIEYFGGVEYQFNSTATVAHIGADITVDAFTLTPVLEASYVGDAASFDGGSLTGTYAINDNLDVYGRLEFDVDPFTHTETAVGVAFRF